jgi:hypothetical protein
MIKLHPESLYLPMLNGEKFRHIRIRVKQCILALTLLISFFATSGYVSNRGKMIGVVNTEVLTTPPSILKNGIGFKRALIALDKRESYCFTPKESPVLGLLLFANIATSHYIHLNLLFSDYISMLQFKLINPAHFSHPDFSNIG